MSMSRTAGGNHSNRMIPKRQTVYKSHRKENAPLNRGGTAFYLTDTIDDASFTKREVPNRLQIIGALRSTGRRGTSIAPTCLACADLHLEPLAASSS